MKTEIDKKKRELRRYNKIYLDRVRLVNSPETMHVSKFQRLKNKTRKIYSQKCSEMYRLLKASVVPIPGTFGYTGRLVSSEKIGAQKGIELVSGDYTSITGNFKHEEMASYPPIFSCPEDQYLVEIYFPEGGEEYIYIRCFSPYSLKAALDYYNPYLLEEDMGPEAPSWAIELIDIHKSRNT